MTLPTWVFGSALARSVSFWVLTWLGMVTSVAGAWNGEFMTWVFFSGWPVYAYGWTRIEDDEEEIVEEVVEMEEEMDW